MWKLQFTAACAIALVLAISAVTILVPTESYEDRFKKIVVEAQHHRCGPEYPPSYGETEPAGMTTCKKAVYQQAYLEFYGVEPSEQQ